jgi:hypothetical protein
VDGNGAGTLLACKREDFKRGMGKKMIYSRFGEIYKDIHDFFKINLYICKKHPKLGG